LAETDEANQEPESTTPAFLTTTPVIAIHAQHLSWTTGETGRRAYLAHGNTGHITQAAAVGKNTGAKRLDTCGTEVLKRETDRRRGSQRFELIASLECLDSIPGVTRRSKSVLEV
jgi:hypothetical protein